MASDFSGHVLRAPRVAPTNSATTAEPTNGVVRDVRPVPVAYNRDGDAPAFVDAWADMYRASVLEAPGSTTVEYLVWAQNTSSLGLVDDPAWYTTTGKGTIPVGTLSFDSFTDGTARVIVTDDGNRSIGSILWLVVERGDVDHDDAGWADEEDPSQGRLGSAPYVVLDVSGNSLDAESGVVPLTQAQITTLGGGLSRDRGDRVVEVRYTVAPARFWWTRNDRYQVRFGWSSKAQRWEPYKGGHTINLGTLTFDETYQVTPKPRGLKIGLVLPGDGNTADAYSMIRLGPSPGALSTPVGPVAGFDGVQVVSDNDVEDGFDFSRAPTVSAVLGVTNGILAFNPAYVELHAGKTIWYVNRDFDPDSDGVVGVLRGSDDDPLFISPIPGPTDYPLLRLGSRRYLVPLLVDNDAALESAVVEEGQVAVSLTTGQLQFSIEDSGKADPDSPFFDKHFFGETVVYDGVSLSGQPQPTKKPVALSVVGGNLYIPDATTLPTEFAAADPYRGLGGSGVLDVPDGTGAVPAEAGTAASVRPGGDNLGSPTTGRIRQIESIGDTFIFSRRGAVKTLQVVDYDTDLDDIRAFAIPRGTAYVAKERTGSGSRVKLSRADTTLFGDDTVYFLQASFLPAVFTNEARLLSKTRFIFRFSGDEVLYFNLDGTSFNWSPSGLIAANPDKDYFTAAEVAANIELTIGAAGQCYEWNGSVVIEAANPATGTVEIGYGVSQTKDLSGAAVLGFLPGWRVKGGITNWLPDSGVCVGLYRSPVNLDRQRGIADFKAVDRVEDVTVQESVAPVPFVFFDQPPLQDIAGVDEGVFFNLTTVIDDPDGTIIVNKPLEHFTDVVHRFGERKFLWVADDTMQTVVQSATTTLGFGKPSIIPESLVGAPGIGGGLYVSDAGGPFVLQELDTDYLLPQDGVSGTALLIERFGRRVLSGGRGRFTAESGAFEDASANFVAPSDEVATNPDGTPMIDDGEIVYLPIVREGYHIRVSSGPGEGYYRITDVASSGTELTVDPPFRADAGEATSWEIFEGLDESVFDPQVVADIVYKPFNHLPEEPLKVNVLSFVGLVPADAAAQAASRLRANMGPAVTRGRVMNIRFGLVPATSANVGTLLALQQQRLGTVANNSLTLPLTDHFTAGAFSIRIGTTKFLSGDGLVGVAAFSADPGEDIQYLTTEWLDPDTGISYERGAVKFGSQVLFDHNQAQAHYVEEFRSPASVPAGTVEYDPHTGALNISSAQLAAFVGQRAYFVERMITEERLDVAINPISGTIGFQEPIQTGQAVEVSYYEADLEGRKVGEQIVEFLPIFVHNEVASRLNHVEYEFNLSGKTIDQSIEPIVYVGAMLQNFGTTDFVVEYPASATGRGKITFVSKSLPAHVEVKVTFAALEANGGERAYEVSTKPAYRPPFFIPAKQDHFGIRGNRTGDFEPGQMIRLGAECFYVKTLTYFPGGDVTRVDIFPPTVDEVGSRSPGNDVITLITARPITTLVDPLAQTPVGTSAPAGFMQAFSVSDFPFEPINRGQTNVIFRGNLTERAVPGHILEINGYPFTITQAELMEDGARTKITVAAPFRTGFSVDTAESVKLSVRPVYPPDVREFLGVGAVLDSEPVTLVLYGEDEAGVEQPGRALIPNVEYTFNPNSGVVQLREPVQAALGPDQRLLLFYTRIRTLAPVLNDGAFVTPRVFAQFLYNTLPSRDNGLEGALLKGTWTFRNPDTLYFRIPTLTQFLGEAVQEAVKEIEAQQRSSGAIRATSAGTNNWQQGIVGLGSERRHLLDKDRAARVFLGFYNTGVVAFEQILEAIGGGFVGDRDGKFRFFIGSGKEYAPPGYEDAITGQVAQRTIWGHVFREARPDFTGTFVETDRIVEPTTATLTDGVMGGETMGSDRLEELLQRQRALILNDVDDRVLVQSVPSTEVKASAPYFLLNVKGSFRRMAEPHNLSRVFPTRTKGFFITYPGIGADEAANEPGVFSFSRQVGGLLDRRSTYRKEIGQIANPVFGPIGNITESSVFKRRARARIWEYLPEGLPANAFGAGNPAAAIEKPVLICTPAVLAEMPVVPDTGFPDHTVLLSQGGTVPDAQAGDPALAVPGFVVGDQVNWGKPDGTTYPALYAQTVDIFGTQAMTGVFVDDVLFGCVLTFRTTDGNPITDANRLLVGTAAADGTPAHEFPINRGDTIYVGPVLNIGEELSDPPTSEDLLRLASAMDTYREGFDIDVKSDGRILDVTLPSFADPFFLGLRELLGQNPPSPLTPLEADVSFVYTGLNPLRIPALAGEWRDDSGDFKIPYLQATNTEKSRLAEVAVGFGDLLTLQNGGKFVYPDEVVGLDGEVVGAAGVGSVFEGAVLKEAAVLMSSQDPFVQTNNPADLGVGNVRPFDFLLVEVNQAGMPNGGEGILSIGAVSSPGSQVGFFEPPRFVTKTTAPTGATSGTGSPVRYTLTNGICFTNPPYPAQPQVSRPNGIKFTVVDTDADGVLDKTVLDFSGISNLVLHNGLTAGAGGFNSIFSADPVDPRFNNKITIRLYARTDPDVQDTPAGLNTPGQMPAAGALLYTLVFERGEVRATEHITNTTNTVAVGVGDVDFGVSYLDTIPVIVGDQCIIIEDAGLLHLTPLGTNDDWFLPFLEVNNGVPGWRKDTYYGWEFTISVDTWNAVPGPSGQSSTAYIGSDRLTFNEVIDMRLAKRRGYTHPANGGTNLEAGLVVHEVNVGIAGGGSRWSYVNRIMNGVDGGSNPIPFTFVKKSSASGDNAGGTWANAVNGVSPERGTLKVMAFEGYNNTEILGTNVAFSAIPSSEFGPSGRICRGIGRCESDANGAVPFAEQFDDRVVVTSVTDGDVSLVVPGDILVIERSNENTHQATTKAGTYLVRHAIDTLGATPQVREVTQTASLNAGSGWVTTKFPTVVSYDSVNNQLTVDQADGFGAAGRLYILLDQSLLGEADVANFKSALVSANYTSITTVGSNKRFNGLSLYRWADNTALNGADLTALQTSAVGRLVSGHLYLSVSVRGPSDGLPDSASIVGAHNTALGAESVYGFRHVTFKTLFQSVGGANVELAASASEIEDSSVPGVGHVGVTDAAPIANTDFDPDPDAVVYPNVPEKLYIELSVAQFGDLNNPHGHAGADVACLLPGSEVVLGKVSTGAAGFWAQAGIFLEPSVPRPVFNLATAFPHIAENGNSIPASEIGLRNFNSLMVPGQVAVTTAEEVQFEVRRIRRFHEIQDAISGDTTPLKYAYEVRRGRITSYAPNDDQTATVGAASFVMEWNTDFPHPTNPLAPFVWNTGDTHTGTNLGAFDDPNVNIHAGDVFRLLDIDGTVLEEVEVHSVVGADEIKLVAPGITKVLAADLIDDGGYRFEVYLRQAPVPHEQSNEQLLDLLTVREIARTDANWATERGGYVPEILAPPDSAAWEAAVNRLYDDLNVTGVGNATWGALGVQRGDIVIIDPAGSLYGTNGEHGARPQGDVGIEDRAEHVAGRPSPLDDNRGFYRVVDILDNDPNGPALLVSGVSTFAGTTSQGVVSDVVFPEDAAFRPDLGHALVPTVNASTLTDDGREGQADLRPTKKRVAGSHSGNDHSLRPFSYRIIRPSNLFSDEAVDLVLTTRERMLSWIEELRGTVDGRKSGNYFVFQRDQHARDVGSPTDPTDGRGVLGNITVESLVGETAVSPFINAGDCLSLLDRRFWILDRMLDSLVPVNNVSSRKVQGGDPAFPNADGPYTAYTSDVTGGSSVRPVLPDRVSMVLDTTDRFRPIRYVWLAYRTHRILGTLAAIERFDAELPKRIEERERLALMRETSESIDA